MNLQGVSLRGRPLTAINPFGSWFSILYSLFSILYSLFSILYSRFSIVYFRFSISHSYLSAAIGSTRVARSAGMKQAPRATPVSRTEIAVNVSGSLGLTP
jgi:hypothetical protein